VRGLIAGDHRKCQLLRLIFPSIREGEISVFRKFQHRAAFMITSVFDRFRMDGKTNRLKFTVLSLEWNEIGNLLAHMDKHSLLNQFWIIDVDLIHLRLICESWVLGKNTVKKNWGLK